MHIDGIVLQVKTQDIPETFVSLRAWQANFHLQAIESLLHCKHKSQALQTNISAAISA